MLPLLQYHRRGQIVPGRPLRVMLAAPHERCCERLDDFLLNSPLFELVGRADAESRALELYFRVRPDVTLLDWRVAANEPARVIGLLRRVAPDAYLVSIVPSFDSMPARAAAALGADAVVSCAMLPAALAALAGATDDIASAESGQCTGFARVDASNPMPATIIGTHNHWAVDSPSDRVPNIPGSGVRKNSAAKRSVP